ncbi:SMI1/KNR4 family protein [Rhodanobacter terrae]|uniref:SMI1/KNR4 family protein n=1 Tax=Rhodanobacter terrae TaxID=418647 RepID=A0ABW0T2K2_9GAMM
MLPADATGKVFRSKSGKFFEVIRPFVGATPKALGLAHGDVLAVDECGNYFLSQSDQVVFWDREDGQFKVLADTFGQFLAGLEVHAPAVLKQRSG